MTISNFDWIQEWYNNQCDGDWEHEFGIQIDTLDNPGWTITINLIDTDQESSSFKPVNIDNDENDWLFCEVRNNNFEASCGPRNLSEVLGIFRNWVSLDI